MNFNTFWQIVVQKVKVLQEINFRLNIITKLSFQITRKPKPFPKLKIKRKIENIEDFQFEDFELEGYECHPAIKMQMSV